MKKFFTSLLISLCLALPAHAQIMPMFSPTHGGKPTQSISFASASSQHLSMTGANFGAYNTAKFTVSVWYKRASTGADMGLTNQGSSPNEAWMLHFTSTDHLEFLASADGTSFGGGDQTTTATFTDTASYHHITYWWDSANATSGDRMRVWHDGTEITSFSTDTAPTNPVFGTSGTITVGGDGVSTGAYNGLEYEAAIFSGVLVSDATLYNSGVPIDITGQVGLWSVLDVGGGAVTHDGKLSGAWTNVGSVTASSTTP